MNTGNSRSRSRSGMNWSMLDSEGSSPLTKEDEGVGLSLPIFLSQKWKVLRRMYHICFFMNRNKLVSLETVQTILKKHTRQSGNLLDNRDIFQANFSVCFWTSGVGVNEYIDWIHSLSKRNTRDDWKKYKVCQEGEDCKSCHHSLSISDNRPQLARHNFRVTNTGEDVSYGIKHIWFTFHFSQW